MMKSGLAMVALCLASARAEEWFAVYKEGGTCNNSNKPAWQRNTYETKHECCKAKFNWRYLKCLENGDETQAPATPVPPQPVHLTMKEHDGEVVEAVLGTIEDGYAKYENNLDQAVTVVGENCQLDWGEKFRLQHTWSTMPCTTFDYVQVKVGGEVVATFCGVVPPRRVLQLEGSEFTLVFHTDATYQNSGFWLSFTCGHEITPEPTPEPAVNDWWPNYKRGVRSCLNGGQPTWQRNVYATKDACCQKHFGWMKEQCLAGGDETKAPPTPEPTPTPEPVFDGAEWWADWSSGVCKNGGAPHWEKTEVSKEVCCQKFFTHKKKTCMKQGSPQA